MLQGLPVSPGIAVGRAVIVRFGGLPAFRRAVAPDEFDEEERRLRRASRLAAEEFRRHSGEAAGDIGMELAAILEAHGLIANRWSESVYRAFRIFLWGGVYGFRTNRLQAYSLVAERRSDPGPRPGNLRRLGHFLGSVVSR